MNFLLNADINNLTIKDDFMSIISLGGQVVLVGMLTVFAVLGLLFGCLTVFKIVFHDAKSTNAKKNVVNESVNDVTSVVEEYTSSDEEIVAVIAAAIAAAESEAGSDVKFKVVSFRRR